MFKKFFLIALLTISSVAIKAQENEVSALSLMPWPQEIQFGSGYFDIDEGFTIYIKGHVKESSRIYKASTRFLRHLTDKTGVFISEGFPNIASDHSKAASVEISFDKVATVQMGIDESYELNIGSDRIGIHAVTDVGAMHALSTLLQLISIHDVSFGFPQLAIKDSPRFKWRGLMLDVARHFMPVEVVKRELDAMAFVKLNVFHWHLSDDQGFRVESNSWPRLHENASDGLYYTQHQISDIVKYADDRGIRVVPEIDVPGHATAILTAYPEFASNQGEEYSIERFAGIFDPTLDPTNENTYVFLDELFKEMTALFPDQYFHIGGDENEGKQWTENADIQKFMKKNKLEDNHALQTYFNIRLEKILANYNKTLMGWEEIMTENMPKSALIHSWKGVNEGMEPGESLIKAVQNGYQTILSNGYYIDLMLPAEEHYVVDPMPEAVLTEAESKRILGGEATMWSELVTPLTIDSRIWPRTAAIAERFWSSQDIKNSDDMYRRLASINEMLELIGVRHIQARDFILRNIANYQDTEGLENLSNISEPYKIYSRNAGGTEYRSYAPFTLFADACTADAKDVRAFRFLVGEYSRSKEESSREALLAYLNTWSNIEAQLISIQPQAPLVKRIVPYAKRVGRIAELLTEALKTGGFSKENRLELEALLNKKEDPLMNLDVELAVTGDILKLAKVLEE